MKESGKDVLLPVFFSGLLGLLGALTGCGSPEGPATSNLQFAHVTAQEAAGGILGRLVANQYGLLETSTTRVCVQPGSHAALSPAETLLEVQLAYATWLSASGDLDDPSWSNFVFELADDCYKNRLNYEAIVAFALDNQIVTKGIAGRPFGSARLTCHRTGPSSTSCQSAYFLFGRATAGKAYIEPAGQAYAYTQESPSLLYMSPFVNWHSLAWELGSRTFEQELADRVTNWLDAYQQLLRTDPYRRSLSELKNVADELRAMKLIAAPDPVEDQLFQDFLSSNKEALDTPYRAHMASYATLLHEVGHQLGMMHAHNPPETSISGRSPDAEKNAKGHWVTYKASMAYGLPYLFLSEDDIAGLQSNYAQLISFFADHSL